MIRPLRSLNGPRQKETGGRDAPASGLVVVSLSSSDFDPQATWLGYRRGTARSFRQAALVGANFAAIATDQRDSNRYQRPLLLTNLATTKRITAPRVAAII